MLQIPCFDSPGSWCDVPNNVGNGIYPMHLCNSDNSSRVRFVVKAEDHGQMICVFQHSCEDHPKNWCGGADLTDRRSMNACVFGRTFVEQSSRCIEHAAYERSDGTYGEIVTRLNSMGPCRNIARARAATPVVPPNALPAE